MPVQAEPRGLMHNGIVTRATDELAIHALLQQKVAAWNARDFVGLRKLWDTDHEPIYIAEEARRPCVTWRELDEYWLQTERGSRAIHVAIRDIVLRPLAPDLIAALYAMHWDFHAAAAAEPVGGDLRVYAVLRRLSADWRFAQYVEAPLAPIVYLRSLYERQVSQDFASR